MTMRIEQRDGRYILTDGIAQRDPTGAELEFWMRLTELEAEVRMLGEIVKGSGMGINGVPLRDFAGLPRIATLLRRADKKR